MALTNCCSFPRHVKVKPIKGKVDIYCTKKKCTWYLQAAHFFVLFCTEVWICSFFPLAGCQGDVLEKMTMTVFPTSYYKFYDLRDHSSPYFWLSIHELYYETYHSLYTKWKWIKVVISFPQIVNIMCHTACMCLINARICRRVTESSDFSCGPQLLMCQRMNLWAKSWFGKNRRITIQDV